LVFELYVAHGRFHAAFLCSLNRFKSTTRRADGYRPATFLRSLYNRGSIKWPFDFLSSLIKYCRATVLKQALPHCFLKFDF